jgi:ABC-type dipeptide/oligopeptide/nickel transport system permease component
MVPGMGKLLLDSVFHRDYTEVQAIVVLITVSVLILNLLLDLVYGWLNPRIRYS